MTVQVWITVALIACSIIGTVTTWGFITGKWTTGETARIHRAEDDLRRLREDIGERFERAGAEYSKAMTYMQGVEERARHTFADRGLTDERFQENRREHDRFNADLDGLKRRQNAR